MAFPSFHESASANLRSTATWPKRRMLNGRSAPLADRMSNLKPRTSEHNEDIKGLKQKHQSVANLTMKRYASETLNVEVPSSDFCTAEIARYVLCCSIFAARALSDEVPSAARGPCSPRAARRGSAALRRALKGRLPYLRRRGLSSPHAGK